MSTPSVEERLDPLAALRVGSPRPLLSQTAESRLGPRHREVLDQLETLFLSQGFTSFTIRELAAGVGCSRRTLYELAPSKGELVLLVLDRFLHRVGRSALAAIRQSSPAVEQIRQYVKGGIELQRQAAAFAEDLAHEPAARRLLDRHFRYVMTVVERFVHLGIEHGELRLVNPVMVAATIAGSSLYLTQPEVIEVIGLEREALVDELLDFLLRSLLD